MQRTMAASPATGNRPQAATQSLTITEPLLHAGFRLPKHAISGELNDHDAIGGDPAHEHGGVQTMQDEAEHRL